MFTQSEYSQLETELRKLQQDRLTIGAQISGIHARLRWMKRKGVTEKGPKRAGVGTLKFDEPEPNYPGRRINGRWVFPGEEGYVA